MRSLLFTRLQLPISAGAAALGAAGITGLGGIIGDIFSSSGASATNQTNMQIAQMNNQFNAQQAQLNRDFQAQQSDTAMQRRVADLKAANLNPLLAVPQGAQAMTGSSAQSAGLPQLQNPSAAYSNLGSVLGQTTAAGMDTYLKQSQAKNIDMDTAIKSSQLPYAGQQAQIATENMRKQGSQLTAQTFQLQAQFDNTVEDTALKMQTNQFRTEIYPSLIAAAQYDATAKRLGLPLLEDQAGFYQTDLGKWAVKIKELGLPASQMIGNAAGAVHSLTSSLEDVANIAQMFMNPTKSIVNKTFNYGVRQGGSFNPPTVFPPKGAMP